MIIKLVLLGVLSLLSVFVVSQRSTSRLLRIAVLSIILGGAFLVWLPEQATLAAHALGVGRGADLLLYLWVVMTLAVILLLYLKLVETNRAITLLAREIALMRPALPAAPRDVAPVDLKRAS